MTEENAVELRAKIERARRLAKLTTDEQARLALLADADELERRLSKD